MLLVLFKVLPVRGIVLGVKVRVLFLAVADESQLVHQLTPAEALVVVKELLCVEMVLECWGVVVVTIWNLGLENTPTAFYRVRVHSIFAYKFLGMVHTLPRVALALDFWNTVVGLPQVTPNNSARLNPLLDFCE